MGAQRTKGARRDGNENEVGSGSEHTSFAGGSREPSDDQARSFWSFVASIALPVTLSLPVK
jgi:hypothetical protein